MNSITRRWNTNRRPAVVSRAKRRSTSCWDTHQCSCLCCHTHTHSHTLRVWTVKFFPQTLFWHLAEMTLSPCVCGLCSVCKHSWFIITLEWMCHDITEHAAGLSALSRARRVCDQQQLQCLEVKLGKSSVKHEAYFLISVTDLWSSTWLLLWQPLFRFSSAPSRFSQWWMKLNLSEFIGSLRVRGGNTVVLQSVVNHVCTLNTQSVCNTRSQNNFSLPDLPVCLSVCPSMKGKFLVSFLNFFQFVLIDLCDGGAVFRRRTTKQK